MASARVAASGHNTICKGFVTNSVVSRTTSNKTNCQATAEDSADDPCPNCGARVPRVFVHGPRTGTCG